MRFASIHSRLPSLPVARLSKGGSLRRVSTSWFNGSIRGYSSAVAHVDDDVKESQSLRLNPVGVQQLSPYLQSQVFAKTFTPPPQDLVELSRDHLRQHELLGKNTERQPEISIDLPPLVGNSLDEHFHKLGAELAEPWLGLSSDFASKALPPKPSPDTWLRRSGWTRYNPDGTTEAVDYPQEKCLVFDVEVLYKESPFAIMACAASTEAWYGWLSPWLLKETENDRQLIPMGNIGERVIVGHNINFDRQKINEEYHIQGTKTGFIDTMSLHIATNGMTSQQRPSWIKHKKLMEKKQDIIEQYGYEANAEFTQLLEDITLEGGAEEEDWMQKSSINSLRDVAKFHCDIQVDKTVRDQFGELDREGVMNNFENLMNYCAGDVEITHTVYSKTLPIFLTKCPHPVTFAAMIRMSSMYLPVDQSWKKYIETAEATYRKLSDAVQERLISLAEKALEIKGEPEKYENDPWLKQLDWSGQEIRMVKGKGRNAAPTPSARQKMPGMPAWYKGLFASATKPINLTVRTRVAPLLLRLSWEGHPLVWSDKYRWTFRVTDPAKVELYEAKHLVKCDMTDEPKLPIQEDTDGVYFKVPHKDGPSARCSNPLGKSYLKAFEDGLLRSEFEYAREALDMNAACSYWISARERIMTQMVVWADDAELGLTPESGVILPQIIPMGTITRRAVERTWLTASNAKKNRVGSELKAMVRAPPGYKFVGADVDSEELWIASLIGDAQFGMHGATALGWMTLEGTKAAGTDLHSKTANILGISRNEAKIFNYGRIYGAGLKFAIQLLQQFNPDVTEVHAKKVAGELYKATKGVKTRTKERGTFWRGGTESFVFNRLEEVAELDTPRTPVLGCAITEALLKQYLGANGFMTSRINWAIQSSGVDYLHLLIVAMEYLIKRHNIDARLCLTVHDEIRYLVSDEDRYRASFAMQVSNLWVRAMFSEQLGIHDLPQSVAFFSAVDIDHVLRKEVDVSCVTPSHPEAIAPGESLNIEQLLHKVNQLDPRDVPKVPINPEKQAYTPRQPVFESLNNALDLGLLKAQVAKTETELRQALHPKEPAQRSGQAKATRSPGRDGNDDPDSWEGCNGYNRRNGYSRNDGYSASTRRGYEERGEYGRNNGDVRSGEAKLLEQRGRVKGEVVEK
ncbi:DNA-directed DNA polymerase gamma mip1 [Saitoella coloradoensis]